MKHVHLITSFFESPFYPNRAPYNEQLFLQLAKHFEITTIRPIAWSEIERSAKFPRYSDYYESDWNGIRIFYPTFWFLPKIGLKLRAWFYRLSIAKTIRRIDQIPDIYYATWAYPDGYATMQLAQRNKRPYVLRVHGSDVNVLGESAAICDKVKAAVENADLVVSPSLALKTKMETLGFNTDKVIVVYSGVDREKFLPRDTLQCQAELGMKNESEPKLLYIGNLKQSKGVIDLVKAASKLVRTGRCFKLYIVGGGPDKQQLEKVISDENLTDLVSLVGQVDHSQLATWINACDVLCLPSYAEGMPNVILEGLSCKIKIVATRVGGIPEAIVEHEQALVEPGDVDSLSMGLDRALFEDGYSTRSAIDIKSYVQLADEMRNRLNNIIKQSG